MSTKMVEYRKATYADAAVAIDLLLQLFTDHDPISLEREVKDDLKNSDQAMFLAFYGTLPVGVVHAALRHDYVNGTSGSPVGFLEGIYVIPAYRRRGIGKSLVNLCQDWASQLGCKEFASDALIANTPSYNFHTSIGFIETERVVYFKRLHRAEDLAGFHFRKIRPEEYPILADFLYEAIFVPQGAELPPQSIIFNPQIHRYIENFGRVGDICFICENDKQVVGAAWARILDQEGAKGYGNIGAGIPELAIAVLPEYRRRGIGSGLLNRLHVALKTEGYDQISLSVQKANPALHFYKRAGYRIHRDQGEDYIMVWENK